MVLTGISRERKMSMDEQQNETKQQVEQKPPGNYIDVFVKRMFSQFVVFVDFLLFYADQSFVHAIDLSKIEPAPTHYIGKGG
jgi:hypothetical protein